MARQAYCGTLGQIGKQGYAQAAARQACYGSLAKPKIAATSAGHNHLTARVKSWRGRRGAQRLQGEKSRSLCGREDGKHSAAAAQASRARAGSGGPQGQSWQQGKKEQRPSWSSTRKLGPRQHVLKDGRWPAQASFCPCSNFCPPSCGQAHASYRGPVHVPGLGGRRGGTVPCEVARGG